MQRVELNKKKAVVMDFYHILAYTFVPVVGTNWDTAFLCLSVEHILHPSNSSL